MVPPKPPIGGVRRLLWLARALRLDGVFVWDHLQDFTPSALWDRDWSWTVGASRSPHELFDFQTLLGALAPAAGRLRLGVLVTEPIRRHPVVIAQALVTLAHLTARPPILGIGAGERENVEPYGLGFAAPVARLEEALAVIRLCLDQGGGPLDFAGRHFQLSRARFDLPIPPARKPEVWVGAHGPRMLRLTGRYGDGWYPVGLLTPGEYAARLAVIRGAAREAGRDPATFVPALQPHLVVAPSEREARAMLAAPPIRFAALLVPADLWRSVGHEHPLGAGSGATSISCRSGTGGTSWRRRWRPCRRSWPRWRRSGGRRRRWWRGWASTWKRAPAISCRRRCPRSSRGAGRWPACRPCSCSPARSGSPQTSR
jgi:phthiodiolone/phenolphthiodiolone dimycocerosates ketoreductase